MVLNMHCFEGLSLLVFTQVLCGGEIHRLKFLILEGCCGKEMHNKQMQGNMKY